MSLYSVVYDLKENEERTVRLQTDYEKLAHDFGENRERLAILPETAQSYSQGLRTISNHYLSQPERKAHHKLEDFWDEEKRAEFNELVEQLDSLGNPFDHCWPLEYIKQSLVTKKRGKLFAVRDDYKLREKIYGGFIGGLLGVTFGSIVSLGMLETINNLPEKSGLIIPAITGAVSGAIVGFRYIPGMLLSLKIKNPFESVASEIDQRAKFISEYIGGKV